MVKVIEVVWDHRTKELAVREASNEGARTLIHAFGVDALQVREIFKDRTVTNIVPHAEVSGVPDFP